MLLYAFVFCRAYVDTSALLIIVKKLPHAHDVQTTTLFGRRVPSVTYPLGAANLMSHAKGVGYFDIL